MLCIYYILMLLSLMLSITFMFMKYPMSMGLILLLQTFMYFIYCNSSWNASFIYLYN